MRKKDQFSLVLSNGSLNSHKLVFEVILAGISESLVHNLVEPIVPTKATQVGLLSFRCRGAIVSSIVCTGSSTRF